MKRLKNNHKKAVGFLKGLLVKLSPFIISFVVIKKMGICYNSITNMDDILLGSIAFSSSSLGFFIAGVSIMQTSNMSRYFTTLTQLGTDKKIISWLLTTIAYMFVLSSLSLIMLFFISNITGVITLILNVWLSLLIAALVSTLFVITIFTIVFTKEK